MDRENPRGEVPFEVLPQFFVGNEGLVDLVVPVVLVGVQFPGIVGIVGPGVISNHPLAIDGGRIAANGMHGRPMDLSDAAAALCRLVSTTA